MTIVLQGMCYAGKTTLGELLGKKLNLPVLDSRDIFMDKYNISEVNYLEKYGREKFIEAEKLSLTTDFDNMIISLGGSAVYYDNIMRQINKKYTVIWLNVSLDIINKRRVNDSVNRSIVYPDGINSFEELFNQRKQLYPKYSTITITINENDTPDDVIEKIVEGLKNIDYIKV